MALDGPPAIWKLGRNVPPPSKLTVPKNSVSVLGVLSRSPGPLPVSLRQSYHDRAMVPVVWPTARRPQNWLFVPVSSLTRTGALQVAPLSSEKRTSRLVSQLLVLGASA